MGCPANSNIQIYTWHDHFAELFSIQKIGSITITYNANGGDVSPTSKSVSYNETYGSLPTPTLRNHTFDGWYTEASGGTRITESNIVSLTENQTLYARWITEYHLDVNAILDGKNSGDLGNYGTVDIYINGKQVSNDVNDYYVKLPEGTTYEIKDIKPKNGYSYNGISSGSRSGTINEETAVFFDFSTISYSGSKTAESTFNGHTYRYYSTAATWYVAKQFCEDIGGHLVTISSAAENEFVKSMIDTNVWTGATDTEQEGVWKWATGEAFSYKNWASGEPNNIPLEYSDSQNHMQLYVDGAWDDNAGCARKPFVCEFDRVENPAAYWVFGRDNYQTTNYYDSFGAEGQPYYVSDADLNKFLELKNPNNTELILLARWFTTNNSVADFRNNNLSAWEGSCYGLALTAALLRVGIEHPEKFGASNTYGIPKLDPRSNTAFESWINIAHISQALDIARKEKIIGTSDPSSTAGQDMFYKASRIGNDASAYPYLVALYRPGGGHSVLCFGAEEGTLTNLERRLGDVTGDGDIGINDVVKLARYVAGVIKNLRDDSAALMGASEEAVIEVGKVQAQPGDSEIAVPVSIAQNPGVAGLTLSIAYDETALTLSKIVKGAVITDEDGELIGTNSSNVNEKYLMWYYDGGEVKDTGALFTLRFKINEDAKVTITASYKLEGKEAVTDSLTVTIQKGSNPATFTVTTENGGKLEDGATSKRFKAGDEVRIKAPSTDNSGNSFRDWTWTGPPNFTISDSESQNASFIMPEGDVSVRANYGGCYVATAVYGSYDCPEVWTLRRFRDNVLAKTWYGRLFIRLYYAVSPTAVRLFGDCGWFQNFFRDRLDAMVSGLQADGFESTPYQDQVW